MSDCLFCKIIVGEIPSHRIYEDDHVLAFLDINPVSHGHALFVPKIHGIDLGTGTKEDARALIGAVYMTAPKLLERLGASGYNLGMNHGADAGQLVFHTHLHFMPRYAGQPRNFVKTHPSQEELAATAKIMRGE